MMRNLKKGDEFRLRKNLKEMEESESWFVNDAIRRVSYQRTILTVAGFNNDHPDQYGVYTNELAPAVTIAGGWIDWGWKADHFENEDLFEI